MNGKALFHFSSILVAIGLISAKSIPAEIAEPSARSEIIDIPAAPSEEDEPSIEVEDSQEQDLIISNSMAPWVKLQEFLTSVGDKLQEKAIDAGNKMKSTANTLSDAIKDFIVAKLEAKKRKKELKKKLVEEFFSNPTVSGNATGSTGKLKAHSNKEVVVVTLAPHITELDEEQNSIYYRK